jgi:2-phospho-L-lactate guanylyltransferase
VRDLAFVVPVKEFARAKDRLRRAGLDNAEAIARHLAEKVVLACAPGPVIVLSESPDVTRFAHDVGAEVLVTSARSLNGAVQLAYRSLASRYSRLVVAHGDLRHPEGLGDYRPGAGVSIFADHRGLGTNVLALPTGLDFHFRYGPDSAARHVRESQRLDVACHLVLDSPWRFDVDEPSDLDDD